MKAIFFALCILPGGCNNIINPNNTGMKETMTNPTQEIKIPVVTPETFEKEMANFCEEITPEKIEAFKNGDLSALPFHCGDGRPDKNFKESTIRRFGAGAGFVVDLVGGLNLLNKEREVESSNDDIETICKIVKNRLGKNLFYHSDSHNHDSERGCGYLNCALNSARDEFGIRESDSYKIKSFLQDIQKIIVEGEHLEKGVVKTHRNEFINKDVDHEYFVWHCDLDDIALKYLAQDVAKELGLNEEEFFQKAREARDRNIGLALVKLNADKLPQIELE